MCLWKEFAVKTVEHSPHKFYTGPMSRFWSFFGTLPNGLVPPRNIETSTDAPTGGRPRYILDLDRAIELHDMGNTEPGCPSFTEIDDDTLDGMVAEISLKHPFAGSSTVQGHLEAQNVHIPIARVKESFRRVDTIGVILEWSYYLHKLRTANNKSPFAIYKLSREKAINGGYWTDLIASHPSYGDDPNEPFLPSMDLVLTPHRRITPSSPTQRLSERRVYM
ncbi:hypothetical protein B0H13DRAFT_1903773 [Mycena leptocephala]|nr:hypothetical protein B0H13DRAFT_1903773 [Mycena leptocephala]